MQTDATPAGAEAGVTKVDRDAIDRLIKHCVHTSAGVGLFPMPWLSMGGVAGVQFYMVSRISKHYNVPFSKNAFRSAVIALIGSAVPHAFSSGCVKLFYMSMPVVGQALSVVAMPIISGAFTWAIGRVFVQHFEAGGNVLNFDPDAMKEYFKQAFAEGKEVAKSMA
jgi:uncharacterized protein (DUF697 family)